MDVIARDVCVAHGFRLTEFQITNGKEIIDTFFCIRDKQGVRQGRNYGSRISGLTKDTGFYGFPGTKIQECSERLLSSESDVWTPPTYLSRLVESIHRFQY